MDERSLLLSGMLQLLSFLAGAAAGRSAGWKTPAPQEMTKHPRREEKRAARAAQSRLETILRNIERYDGTPCGQEDVPGKDGP